MQQPIVSFHQDDIGDWVADLACGHTQHVRHQPPWVLRPWVLTASGRRQYLGWPLQCRLCEQQKHDPTRQGETNLPETA